MALSLASFSWSAESPVKWDWVETDWAPRAIEGLRRSCISGDKRVDS